MAFLFGDSNGKKELYRKILGTIDPGAKEGVCALYDTADGKCAEGMSVRKIAEIAARGMMGTPTAEPELATNWVLGPTFSDLSGVYSLCTMIALACEHSDSHTHTLSLERMR